MDASIDQYLTSLKNRNRETDARLLLPIMEKASGYAPYLTGTMIGFGSYHYRYESGQEGDVFVTGFAPRAQNMVVYIMPGFSGLESQLDKLGKHKLGKSCLYLGRLNKINLEALSDIVAQSVHVMQNRYECLPHPPQKS